MQLEDVRGQLSRGYHLPTVHPALNRELPDFFNAYIRQPRAHHVPPVEPDPRAQPGDATPRRYQEARDGLTTDYLWAFPNWMLNCYPDNVSLNMILPLEPERTLGHLRVLSSGKGIWAAKAPSPSGSATRSTRKTSPFVKPCRKTCTPASISEGPLPAWEQEKGGSHAFHRMYAESH